MKLDKNIKPISYVKEHASEIVRQVSEERTPYIITINGEAKVVMQDVQSYMETQNTLAMLKIIAMSEEAVRQGKVHTLDEAIPSIRKKLRERLNK